jgi:hypothetical protein
MMRATPGLLVATISFAACSNAAPDDPPAAQAPSAAESRTPQAPPLMPGMGKHHHAIATTSAEAQRYFDQGFNLVFGFNHEEAVRAFRRAADLDAKAPMPHWGIAWALGPNYNLDVDDDRGKQANAAIAQALALSNGGSEAERAYVEAMAIRFPADARPDRAALARKYSDAMRDLSRRYPDDLDAATLYAESLMNLRAWKLWSLDGKPAERTEEIVAVLESVLARDPNHGCQPLLHPHSGSLAGSRPCSVERHAARHPCARRRPPDTHAGAHLRPCRRPCCGGARQRGGRQGRP